MAASPPLVRFFPVAHIAGATTRWGTEWLRRQLSETELQEWHSRRPGRTRDEWTAGRLAAKLVLRRLSERLGRIAPAPTTIEIEPSRGPQDTGRPTTRLPFFVSIAHSRGLAAAAAATSQVGIDVECRERSWPPNVLALLDEVAAGLPADRRPDAVTTWTCVEAVLKHRGCGLNHGVTVVSLTNVAEDGTFTWVDHLSSPPRPGGAFGRVGRTGRHSVALVWGDLPPAGQDPDRTSEATA